MHLLTKYTIINAKYCLFRWFLFSFLVSVSAASMPCPVVNSLGLFGEVKATAIVCEEKEEAVEAGVKRYQSNLRGTHEISEQARQPGSSFAGINGIDIFNIWFVLFAAVLYFCYVQYKNRLPDKDTIVTLKVRMDN